MAAINGLTADVAWTGYTGLYASVGYLKPYAFSLDVQGGVFPTTGLNGATTITATNSALPYSWGGSLTCRGINPPQSGYSGNVSWGSGNYSTNVREWTCDVAWGEKETTAFTGSAVNAKTFIPLLASWGGTFAGYIDDTTALELPTLPNGTLQALTLKLFEAGATDDELAGAAAVTQMGADTGVETGGDFSYGYTGSGTLTATGVGYTVNTSGIFDDTTGALLTPTAGSLVLTAATSRTYTGNAFPTGVSWRVGVAEAIEVTINFRGTGALTIA